MSNDTNENAVNLSEMPREMTLKQVGEQIKWARKAKGYSTQQELADAVGFDKDLINAIENGRKKAGMNAYDAIAKFLGIRYAITFPIEEGREEK